MDEQNNEPQSSEENTQEKSVEQQPAAPESAPRPPAQTAAPSAPQSGAPRPTPAPPQPPQNPYSQPQQTNWQQPRNGRMMPPGYQQQPHQQGQWNGGPTPPRNPYGQQPGPYGPPPQGYGPPNYQQPQGRNRALPLIIGLIIFAVVVGIGAVGFFGSSLMGSSSTTTGGGAFSMFGSRVGVLEIEGVLGEGVGYGANTEELVKQVESWTENDSIKAMVLRINSPGGAVSATQDLVHAINKFSDTGRPVYASMGDIAASGGYYAATAADEIYANEGTLTGSIGVIMSFYNYAGLLEKIGVYSQSVKSGEFKDIGSGTREMTPAEQALLDGMVLDVYQQFLDEVVASRSDKVQELHKISNADAIRTHIATYADGRIFSGRQALDAGMIDQLGTLDETIDAAAKKAGLGNYSVVRAPVRQPGLFGAIGALSNKAQAMASDQAGMVKLEYRFGM